MIRLFGLLTTLLLIPLLVSAQIDVKSLPLEQPDNEQSITSEKLPILTANNKETLHTASLLAFRPFRLDKREPATSPAQNSVESSASPKPSIAKLNGQGGFHWKPALQQYLLMLAVQHGYALTQDKTRRELRGPFVKDYFRAVSNLSGWADGGRFFTNYIAHPMEGAIYGYIQIQNDPKGITQKFGRSRHYWNSRLKAMAWSAAASTQFEIGPLSQASIGNVGRDRGHDDKKRKLTYVDIVVTPTLGTAWLLGEDMLDRYMIGFVERKTNNLFLRNMLRVTLNPMRSCANLLRFKNLWHRDR